jgi:hypothetical protein
MKLKRVFTTGERATYRIAQEVSVEFGVEAFAKMRIADVLVIDRSGISNEEYSYALKAHFDVLVVQADGGLPVLAVEFDGRGHDANNDHLKNRLCDHFGFPLVRIGMEHINNKNFQDTALHFLIRQWFLVDGFMKHFGPDMEEIYDPVCFITPNASGKPHFPYWYEARWRNRLIKPFKQNAHLFGERYRTFYEHGTPVGFFSRLFVRKRQDFRVICGQGVDDTTLIIGTAQLDFQAFGIITDDERHWNFMQVDPFVEGLAAADLYENAMAFINGDRSSLQTMEQVNATLRDWKAEGFNIKHGSGLIPDLNMDV